MYRDNSYILSISINKKLDYSAPIYFVPLGTPYSAKSRIYPEPVEGKGKPPRTTHNKPAATQVPVKKTTPVIQAKPVTVVTPKKTTEPIKKELPKTEIKKIEEVKKEIPKVEPKKEVKPTQQAAPVVEPPKPEPIKTTAAQKTQSPIAQALDTQQTIAPVIPENAQISHNYREVEALRRSAQLQKELVQKWKPPIGVSPDCMCEISFFVNSTGAIEDLKMVKSSGVVMYDISARQALFAMKMPQWSYGKPFTISFKQ